MARVKGDWLIPLPDGMTRRRGDGDRHRRLHGDAGGDGAGAPRHHAGARAGGGDRRGRRRRLDGDRAAGRARLHGARGHRARPARRTISRTSAPARSSTAAELAAPPKLLAKERWAAGIDAVGGAILANVLSMTMAERRGRRLRQRRRHGACRPRWRRSSCAASRFSASTRSTRRRRAASRHGSGSPATSTASKLAAMTTTIGFADIAAAARDIVEGKVRGRIVVTID